MLSDCAGCRKRVATERQIWTQKRERQRYAVKTQKCPAKNEGFHAAITNQYGRANHRENARYGLTSLDYARHIRT